MSNNIHLVKDNSHVIQFYYLIKALTCHSKYSTQNVPFASVKTCMF